MSSNEATRLQQLQQQQHLQYQSQSQLESNNSVNSNSANRPVRRGSLLGASTRKIKASVRRPLRKVGRFVGRGRSGGIRNGCEVDGDGGHEGDIEEDAEEHLRGGCVMPDDGSVQSDGILPRQLHHDGETLLSPALDTGSLVINSTTTGTGVEGDGMFHHQHYVNDPDWPVNTMERLLRQVLLILAAYILGAKRPEWLLSVSRATEYAVTAWGTCVIITMLAYLQHHCPYFHQSNRARDVAPVTFIPSTKRLKDTISANNASDDEDIINGDERTPLLHPREQSQQQALSVASDPIATTPIVIDSDTEPIPLERSISMDENFEYPMSSTAAPENNHPALEHYYVMNAYTGERIFPNSSEPVQISTEWFDMSMLVLIRTPDVDDPTAEAGNASNRKVSDYIRGKQRRFEFQYQIKLKKVPDGKAVYFACELDEPIKMGIIQRAFVGAAMAFMKTTNPTFHYSIMGSKKNADLNYEKPHMSFTVEGSLDRLVVTKPDETPPELGTAIHEDPESMKRRKKGVPIQWNTEDTYTMALWSAYVDFLDWRVINLPGIRPFTLSSVLGSQCINLTMYLISEDRGNDKHQLSDITNVINLELSNSRMSSLGPVAKKWEEKHKRGRHKRNTMKAPLKNNKYGASGNDEPRGQSSSIVPPRLNKNNASIQLAAEPESTNFEDAIANSAEINDSAVPGTIDPTASADGNREGTLNEIMLDEIEEVDQEAATAAELGEGLYLRSGDSVVLREFIVDGEQGNNNSTVANGGGFVVLQNQEAPVIIYKPREAKHRSRLIKTGDTVMFKMVQKKGDEKETRYLTIHRGWWLKWVSSVPKKNGYFTIYTHDEEFSQHDEKRLQSSETQSSFLTMGGSFILRHKRWKNYYVGVAAKPSLTYGGRMLGLYTPEQEKGDAIQTNDDHYHSDDDIAPVGELETDADSTDDRSKSKLWMKPLLLCAHDPSSSLVSNGVSSKLGVADSQATLDGVEAETAGTSSVTPAKLIFSRNHSHIDVPAWLEMMSRTERTRQLTYVVRVMDRGYSISQDSKQEDTESSDIDSDKFIVRLRSGRELAQIIRIGQSWRNLGCDSLNRPVPSGTGNNLALTNGDTNLTPKTLSNKRMMRYDGSIQPLEKFHARACSVGEFMTIPSSQPLEKLHARAYSVGEHLPTPPRRDPILSDPGARVQGSSSADQMELAQESFTGDDEQIEPSDDESDESTEEGEENSVERDNWLEEKGVGLSNEEPEVDIDSQEKSKPVRKSRQIIGKVAKRAKTATGKVAAGTGKLTGKVAKGTSKIAVLSSKKVAKGTVNVGKSVVGPISRKSKKPPTQEPRAKQATKDRKRQERDHHLAVNKSMKRIERIESKAARSPSVLAGELCAPEQSCRTASRIMSRMSSLPHNSPSWAKCNGMLSSQLSSETELDRCFLQGDNVQIGVKPLGGDKSRGRLIHASLVARCLWESHWREEWCGMHESCVSFYAPLTKSPCLEIAFIDIQNVRPLDAGGLSPLPGFPLLVLETAWLCHYLAFRDEDARDTFGDLVDSAIRRHLHQVEESAALGDSDIRKARFWQGFQNHSERSVSSGRGKWAKISSSQKTKHRIILNARRMVFDLQTNTLGSDITNGYAFVEDLFRTVLSFSMATLENDPDSFVAFLDATSQLRLLRIEEVDRSSKQSFCLFVNLYHCLLQHALLLSTNETLNKRSVGHFMRTHCYEIGCDVFSLAELHSCIIRGKMPRPVNPKPPYIEAPKKSNPYLFYALDFTDPRVNFAVNTGDDACPNKVLMLRADDVEHQLSDAAAMFLRKEVYVDVGKRCVFLPKVCETYKHDFGSDSLSCLRYCLGYLDEASATTIKIMMMEDTPVTVRFRAISEKYHTSLGLYEPPSRKQEREEVVPSTGLNTMADS